MFHKVYYFYNLINKITLIKDILVVDIFILLFNNFLYLENWKFISFQVALLINKIRKLFTFSRV